MPPAFPPVPWPEWIGRPEPQFLKTLPGGSVTAGTAVIIVLGILWQLIRLLFKCFRRKKDINAHEEAAAAAGGATALEGCIGPKLCLVFKQEEECKAPSECCTPLLHPRSKLRDDVMNWLNSPEHVICVPISFPEGSELYKHEVWVIGITEEELKNCAEQYQRRKLADSEFIHKRFEQFTGKRRKHTYLAGAEDAGSAPRWFQKHVSEVERTRLLDRLHDRTGKFNTWLPYTKEREEMGLFKLPKEGTDFFSPSEVMQILLNVIGHAQDEKGVPIVMAAYEVGEIEAYFPIIDRARDKAEFRKVLDSWRSIFFWRKPPVEDLARLFGPSVAVYFSYMQMYAMNLIWPALVVVCSLVWHLHYRDAGRNLRWGAAFGEGWSQGSFALCLSTWSTLFFLQWSQRVSADVYRLGQDELHKDVYSMDGTRLYFQKRGFKVSRKRGVEINKWFRPLDRHRISRGIITYLSIFLFLATSVGVVAGLCWISDKAALVQYSSNEDLDELLKNGISVASYLVVSTPLQGVYDKLTDWITHRENRQEASEFVDRLTRRRAFFQLVNYMGWFLYLGFYAQNIVALRSQLMVFFILKPSGLLGTFVELLSLLCFRHKEYEQNQLVEMIEQEWQKPEPNLFDEYLEVTIIFAAALLFAPIFPEGLIIALLHTYFEFIADKVKLYRHVRVHIPKGHDFFAVGAWVRIWQSLSWVGIFVSSWLVNVFLSTENISEQVHTWDPNESIRWDSDLFHGEPPVERRMYTIVILEHFLLICKAYLNITVSGRSKEVEIHHDIVHRVLEIDGSVKHNKELPSFFQPRAQS